MSSIGILTNIPTPYRKPMWEIYATINEISLDIYYCAETEADRKWTFEKSFNVKEHFLPGYTFKKTFHFNPSVFSIVKKHDLWLIGGYSIPSAQLLILLCKLLKIPYVILFDGISPLKIYQQEPFLLFFWKKFLVSNCLAWLGNGIVGKEYGEKLGIDSSRIFNQYLTVDVNHFMSFKEERESIKKNFRSRYSIMLDSFVITYSGRLIKLKGVHNLIEAYKIVKKQNPSKKIQLVLAGHGDFENILREKARETSEVHFLGNIMYEKIHELYYSSDILVLPSFNDPWGLVLNEALACGIPTIASSATGATKDLLHPEHVFNPDDTNLMAQIIMSIMEKHKNTPNETCPMISKWTYENAKQSLMLAMERLQKI